MAQENGGNAGPHRLSLDSVLELLSHYQRREIIRYCRDVPQDKVSMQSLINHLMDVEMDRTGQEPGTGHLQSVLIHVHGPKLAAADIVDYDVEDQYIEYFPNSEIETAMSHLDSLEAEW